MDIDNLQLFLPEHYNDNTFKQLICHLVYEMSENSDTDSS